MTPLALYASRGLPYALGIRGVGVRLVVARRTQLTLNVVEVLAGTTDRVDASGVVLDAGRDGIGGGDGLGALSAGGLVGAEAVAILLNVGDLVLRRVRNGV